jgi:NAD(P)-dependent dehydrogenase (short-subunit alcohol dehydrogenase family)
MGQVEGKVAIVTGGASGIGAACAATLAREGAKVVITDIDDAGAQAVVGEIVAAGGDAICLYQDVSIELEWPRVIEATERRFGPLNVMMAMPGSAFCARLSRYLWPIGGDKRRSTSTGCSCR